MQVTRKPEILSPRMRRGSKAFDDENLDLLSHLLDDWFRIPGTSIRFGLDGIVGFIPGRGRRHRRHRVVHHHRCGVGARRLVRDAGADAGQLGHRGAAGHGAGAGQPVRHRVEGEPAQLRAADRQPRRPAGHASGGAGCSSPCSA